MKKIVIGIVIAALFCLVTFPAFTMEKPPAKPDKEKMEQVRKKMDLLRNWRIMDELNLDEATAIKFFKALKTFDDKERQIFDEGFGLTDKLREAVEKEKTDDKEIQSLINKIDANMDALNDLKKQKFEAMKSLLTPAQQGKFILFEMNFRKDMIGLAGKAMNMGPHPMREMEPGPGGPGGPDQQMPHRP